MRRWRSRLARFARRIPRAAWICGLVACLNAVGWSIVTPAFQTPDEPAHFAYVKQLAETGELPSSESEAFSGEENTVLHALHQGAIRQRPQNQTIATQAEQDALEGAASSTPHETGSPAAGVATSQPPLYYALEAIPYKIASGGTVLDRLQLMRLTSALFAGLTAIFAFLFIRETLPGARWAWTVGGLSVALSPLLGFMSGAINPDSLLFAASAANFYCLARSFRRGLSIGGAAAIGAVTAVGLLTKLNFIGLVPGILLGLLLLTLRAARASGRSALRPLALGVAIVASAVALYCGINALSNQPLLGLLSRSSPISGRSLVAEANYIWQLYLPRLPGTVNDFPGLFTTRQLWFNGYVGLYGWLDTTFPSWVYSVSLIPAVALMLLCGRALVLARSALRARIAELAVYATTAVGLMALVGAASYNVFPQLDAEYAQARYLLPLLALFGAALALAARGAGRRWGPTAGTLIVVLLLAHDIFSQMLVVARYYG
jgi:4-amino-4-deoxy-L-arabinose transferase-like glycosyltransferase